MQLQSKLLSLAIEKTTGVLVQQEIVCTQKDTLSIENGIMGITELPQ